MEDTNKHKHDILRRQGAVLVPAIAYGDAAGLPVETRTAAYISEHHGTIATLLPTSENAFFGSENNPGVWSDDTQLTMAVARALINANGFNLNAFAETHIDAYNETPDMIKKGEQVKRGWGVSTVTAMEQLRAGISPKHSGTIGGTGNGVLMKMAPLAYWQAVRRTPLQRVIHEYDQLTSMTHDSAVARMTTRIHGDVLAYLLREEYDKRQFMNVLEGSIVLHEFETREFGGYPLGYMRDQIDYLHGTVNTQAILSETDAKGFYAPQTLAMAYGAFIAHEGKFIPAVYEAVNLGGDTDSLASIVAAMSAFSTKEALCMPPDSQHLDRLDELRILSRKLAAAAFLYEV